MAELNDDNAEAVAAWRDRVGTLRRGRECRAGSALEGLPGTDLPTVDVRRDRSTGT